MKRRTRPPSAADELGNLLGEALTDLGRNYFKQATAAAPEACPCIACQFSRLMGNVSTHATRLVANPRAAAGVAIRDLAQSAQAAAERRAPNSSTGGMIGNALRVVNHSAAELNRIRKTKQPAESMQLKQNPDGSYSL